MKQYKGELNMKKAMKIIIAVLLVVVITLGGFVFFKSSQGISYDISTVEKIESDVEIVKEDIDSITLKKNSDGDFKVLMFTDTHLNGKKEDNTTVSYIVKNVTDQKPDLVIFGGDNVSSGFDSGLMDAMKEKGSAQAVCFGHGHVNNFGVIYEDILLSYIQPSSYGVYNMETKFDSPENEWIQGCTLLNIKADGTYTAEQIYNHK